MNQNKTTIYPPLSDIFISKAEGVYVYDEINNKKYIDLSGAAGMSIIGYGHPCLKKVIKNQPNKLLVSPQKHQTEEAYNLAGKLLSLLPEEYDAVLPCVTGSEAVEMAMQISINHTGSDNFLSFDRAYHGHTFGAGSLGEGDCNFFIDDSLNKFDTISVPKNKKESEKVLNYLKTQISRKKYAAFILEGVVTNMGYSKPPSFFYKELRKLCDQKNILLVFDEVLTGFGRTGELFSFMHHSVLPDVICLAKGLSSGYAAIGAVVTKKNTVQNFDYFATFAWSPLSCAIASANLEVITKDNLTENSKNLGAYVLDILKRKLLSCPIVNGVRGVGLGIGVELKDKKDVNLIYNKCLEKGVVVFKNPYAGIIFIQPPLIIKKAEAEAALKKFVSAIAEIYNSNYH